MAQSLKDKQFNDVLYHDVKTPRPLRWEYQTADSAAWTEVDSYTLLFKVIPTGKVTAYRQKTDGAL